MIKKVYQLTKIFLKDYFEKINFIKNKNSFSVIIIIFMFCLIYLSYNIIEYLQKINETILFLQIYLPLLALIMIFQLIIVTVNILFYSKDLEYIIHLPIRPKELLIAKLITIITIMYITEILFLVIPMFIYGIFIVGTVNYFVIGIITLLIFPVLYTLIITIVCSIIMNFSKIIKNKDVLQILIILFLTMTLVFFIYKIYNNVFLEKYDDTFSKIEILKIKMEKANEYFLQINPIIKMLMSTNIFYCIGSLLKIVLYNIILFLLLIKINTKTYYTNILRILNEKKIKKENKNKENKNRYKKSRKEKIYLKNEIKKILKDLTYFNQGIYQYICIGFVIIFIMNFLIPIIVDGFIQDNTIEQVGVEQFKFQVICLIIAIIQFLFTFNNLSITAISRDGREAIFMKYIPMSLYKQFLLKNIPQIILNTIIILLILLTIFINVGQRIHYYVIIFILGMLVNVIDSEIMLLIDCKKPDLNWINKESVMKNNEKKIYKFVFLVFVCIVLKYCTKIFQNISFIYSSLIMMLVILLILIVLNIYIKKNINKIFKNIY